MSKSNTPVFLIKPKYIFKSPFLKYDLQNPTNREAQNEQLTEYFNYGFNEDTMNIYAKLVNRTLKVLDHKRNLEYFDEPSELMRLNDQIPMDFGGFCKFYDPTLFKNDFIQNDQQLFKVFLFNTFKASYIKGKQYPMLEFVKSMYPKKVNDKPQDQQQDDDEQNILPQMIDQISKNLQRKYEQTMVKLIEQKNQPKQSTFNPNLKKTAKFDKAEKQKKIQGKVKEQVDIKKQNGQKKLKRGRQRSKSSSSSSSSGSSSSSSQSSGARRKRKNKKNKKQTNKQKDKDHKVGRSKQKRSKQRRSKEKRQKDRRSKSKDKKKSDRYDRNDRHGQSSRHDSRDPRKSSKPVESKHSSKHDLSRRQTHDKDKDRHRGKQSQRSRSREQNRDRRHR